MYIKIDNDLYKKIQTITCVDYEANGDFLPCESIEPMLEDLICEIERLEEKYSELEQNLNENYEPIPYAKQIGYNERDFY